MWGCFVITCPMIALDVLFLDIILELAAMQQPVIERMHLH